SVGGSAARRLLPAAILLPLLVGWLRVLGERAGLYGLGFGSALFATVLMAMLVALIVWTARALDRLEAERQRVAESLGQSSARAEARLEMALAAGKTGTWE